MRSSHSNDTDIISDLRRKNVELERTIQRLRNTRTTTLPVYNKAALPPNMQENEIFVGTDGTVNLYRGGGVIVIGP